MATGGDVKMTIAFDAGSSGSTGWAGSVTVSHTVSGTDRILIAGCSHNSLSDKVSGVTYNGVSMTRIRADFLSNGSTCLYYLIAPATGTHDLVFTFASSDVAAVCVGASFTGVDQATPVSSDAGWTGSYATSPRSLTVTTTTGGVAVDIIGSGLSHTFSVGAGQTQVANLNNGGTVWAAMSYETDASDMGWTWPEASNPIGQSSASLRAASASGATITGNLGTATASGFAAAILTSVTIACSMGGATASGHQATISTGSNVTISCAVGTATASGYSASVVSSGSATITTDPFKNNTGTVLSSTSIPKAVAIKLSDLTVGASWTNQTTNGSGVLSLTGAMAGGDYLLVVSSADGSAVGVKKYTAS